MSPAERAFWKRVDISSDPAACWLWTGCVDPSGYGRVRFNGKVRGAHRVALQLVHERDPGTSLVCHACDNPTCCNPFHLWAGTPVDNMRDMHNKGRAKYPRVTDEMAAAILLDTRPGSHVARAFGVSEATISRLRASAGRS
jgi:hypothetical protein